MWGKDLKLSIGGNEIIRARDVTINEATNMMESTSRDSDGDEEVEPGTRSASIDFDIKATVGDTSLTALDTAKKAGTQVAISVETVFGTKTGVGFIETLNESQPKEDVVTVDVTVKVSGGLTKA